MEFTSIFTVLELYTQFVFFIPYFSTGTDRGNHRVARVLMKPGWIIRAHISHKFTQDNDIIVQNKGQQINEYIYIYIYHIYGIYHSLTPPRANFLRDRCPSYYVMVTRVGYLTLDRGSSVIQLSGPQSYVVKYIIWRHYTKQSFCYRYKLTTTWDGGLQKASTLTNLLLNKMFVSRLYLVCTLWYQ